MIPIRCTMEITQHGQLDRIRQSSLRMIIEDALDMDNGWHWLMTAAVKDVMICIDHRRFILRVIGEVWGADHQFMADHELESISGPYALHGPYGCQIMNDPISQEV